MNERAILAELPTLRERILQIAIWCESIPADIEKLSSSAVIAHELRQIANKLLQPSATVDQNGECACEFDSVEQDGEQSWHYTRICLRCGRTWDSLHCVHDQLKRYCGEC